MVLAYHVIFTAYGFWLPNDPRGFWSQFVAGWELLLAGGKATTTTRRHSLARDQHDRAKRLKTKAALKWPPVNFTGDQALSVARGFAQAAVDAGYVIYASSILPAHVHMVIARHARIVERIVGHLKSAGTRQLDADGLHPFDGTSHGGSLRPSPWAESCWKVFLDSPADVSRAIQYVENNPIKEGKRRQRWSFVRAYRG